MMTPDEIRGLAEDRYRDDADEPTARLFCLLVAVADEYVKALEAGAGADEPAPYLGGATPLAAAMDGLRENLEMLRGDRGAGNR
jgi:hypothetical protein